MFKVCSIISCKSQYASGGGITYHSFPLQDTEQKKWLNSIPANLINKVTARTFVCSLHFRAEDYYNTLTGSNFLKRDAIPTRFKLSPGLEQLEEENRKFVESIGFEDKENMSPTPIVNKVDAATQISLKRLKPSSREETLMSQVASSCPDIDGNK